MSFLYAEPLDSSSPSECFFYHSMTLPDFGEIQGHWDLRDVAHAYLGNVEFAGKRVLDVGAASGFLTFEMEKRGAEVVSFDLDDGANWDVVPHFKIRQQLPQIRIAQIIETGSNAEVIAEQRRLQELLTPRGNRNAPASAVHPADSLASNGGRPAGLS